MVMRFILITLLSLFLFEKINAIENKIIIKINNKIISSIDLKNEQNYLTTMNGGLKDFTKKELYQIAKNSLITEKIKENYILEYYEIDKISDNYVNKIIENMIKSKNFQDLNQLKYFLKENNLNLSVIKKKIRIQLGWNELILKKYVNKIVINEDRIKKKIIENQKQFSKQILYNLSEILFTTKNDEGVNKIYNNINQKIRDQGFTSAVKLYSESDSSTNGGNIGWINKINLSDNIKKNIENLKIGEYTRPILITGGYLVLMINDKKNEKNELDINKQYKKYVEYEQTRQLNEFSKIHYNKLRMNTEISE
tara:strand:- start:26 stop:955 length:930 start_codon:yes stop_codon:yes gene_type:complete